MNNKIKKIVSIMMLVMMVLTTINVNKVQANSDINIFVNGQIMQTDTSPVIVNSRVLVPFRVIFENLGARNIEWANSTRQVKAVINGKLIELKIDNNIAYVNGKATLLDSPPIIRNGRTLVPIRFVAESSGKNQVGWNAEKREVHINTNVSEVPGTSETPEISDKKDISNVNLNKSLYIGENVESFISKFGQPDRRDLSELGYTWYIYNNDLENYFQVGVHDGKVVAFASNSTNWEYDSFKIGRNHNNLDISEHSYNKDGNNTTILADRLLDKGSYLVSTIIIVKDTFATKERNYSQDVLNGLSLQLHDLANVYRVRNNLKPLRLNDKLTELARYHSTDMATNNFFSHTSSNGDTFSDRVNKMVARRLTSGENISMGYSNALYSINGLYNSLGHRKNILGQEYELSGTSAIYGNNVVYYTHNFSSEQ